MRTIDEIKAEIGATYIAQAVVKEKYGLKEDTVFEKVFAKFSIESLLFHAVATAIYSIEWIRERFASDADELRSRSLVGSKKWYEDQCMRWLYGNESELVWDTDTASWHYSSTSTGKNILSDCAASNKDGKVIIKVNKRVMNENTKVEERVPLSAEEIESLQSFLDKVKIAGAEIIIHSGVGSLLASSLNIYYDPTKIKDSKDLKEQVHNAKKSYLDSIPYDGYFEISALIRAVMNVPGIVNAGLNSVTANVAGVGGTMTSLAINGNIHMSTYRSEDGFFTPYMNVFIGNYITLDKYFAV